jgi:polyisoprenoid-binding protein YceI
VLLGAAAPGAGASPEAPDHEEGEAPPGSITFVGRNALVKARGRFHRWRFSEVRIDRERPEAGLVEVEVEVGSLDTGIGRRDAHLRSDDFFDVERHPRAVIRVRDARQQGTSQAGYPLYAARFELEIRGVAKTVEGSFEVLGEHPPEVRGSLVLNRIDFGVGGPHRRWNPMSVREEIPVEFHAVLPED